LYTFFGKPEEAIAFLAEQVANPLRIIVDMIDIRFSGFRELFLADRTAVVLGFQLLIEPFEGDTVDAFQDGVFVFLRVFVFPLIPCGSVDGGLFSVVPLASDIDAKTTTTRAIPIFWA